ncbi:hypothetical protein SKAU_G00222330 [Synaphobranchus kaupii]|uniref:Membrane-spanning 4-domains subfamily A member 4A-like n=1 Tax=Synaphobranchus kaupii TaxID=118154 RepID=A0A9Q1FBI3_SYNKA|nr:hypothetical protein SKAU_G00222330 [Synaphobranchus kaupii]
MASSTANGFVVVTQMYPQQGDTAAPVICTIPQASSVLGKFLKGDPKALGTVQIIIGMMYILLGIVMTIYADSIGVFSGIVFWGAFIYISSGALTVAANNKLNKCLVKGALVMNIFSTITAGLAIIIFSLDFVIDFSYYFCYDYHYSSTGMNTNMCEHLWRKLKARSNGITGVLLAFSILEFLISICVSAFACRAVCDCSSVQVVFIPHQSNVPPGNLIPAPSTCETEIPQVLGQSVMGNKQADRPPPYAEALP